MVFHPKLVTYEENGVTYKAFSLEEFIELPDDLSFIDAIDLGYFDIKYTKTIKEENGKKSIVYEFDYS